MQMSRQPGIRQQFFRKLEPLLPQLAVLQLQLFDLLARFCVCFVIEELTFCPFTHGLGHWQGDGNGGIFFR
jgi:hypothetical protein